MRVLFAVSALTTSGAMLMGAPAMAAPTFFETYLSRGKCYAQTYSTQHMRRNPKQTITKFQVHLDDKDPINAQRPKAYAVRFGFMSTNGKFYDGIGICRSTNAGEACSAEGDGGQFALNGSGRKIKVTLGDRLMIESKNGFSPNIATAANRTILLSQGPGSACPR